MMDPSRSPATRRRAPAKAAANAALTRWMKEVRTAVSEHCPQEVGRAYGPRTSRHFRELATLVEARFGDHALTRSAFLHGVPVQYLERLPDDLVGEPVRRVLEERGKLRSLDPDDRDVRAQLLANVLPALAEARAIVLFVVEQLFHLDPRGEITAWSLRARHQPLPALPDLGAGPWFKRPSDRETAAQFVASVAAPAAEFFGLRLEREALENAAVLHFQPLQVARCWAALKLEARAGGTWEKAIRGTVSALPGLDLEVTWEWRHLGELVRRLPPILLPEEPPETLSPKNVPAWIDARNKARKRFLSHAGNVKVTCRDRADCYRALGLLHERFAHRPSEIEDQLGRRDGFGRRLLRTILVQPEGVFDDDLAGEAPGLTVVIQPREEVPHDEEPVGRRHLEAIQGWQHRKAGEDHRVFTVFAPDGKAWELTAGATVLEFAAAVNHQWLAHLAGATINRRPVGLLRRLEPGNIVWLDVREEYRPLPQGWSERMTTDEVRKRIAREFRRHYRPALESEGRRWLRQQLALHGVDRVPEDKYLDPLLEKAGEALGHFSSRKLPDSSTLLRMLGLFAAQARGVELPYEAYGDKSLPERLVAQTATEIHKSRIKVDDLDLPRALQERTRRVELCSKCGPTFDRELSATLEGSTLRLHVPQAACAEGGVPVYRLRSLTPPQYFVIQARNRVGLGAEILDVFRRNDIYVREFVGVEVNRGLGVARVGIDRVSKAVSESLGEALGRIPGRMQLVTPETAEPPDWEAPLPRRELLGATARHRDAPYVCGNPIIDDAYFYGMHGCRERLEKLFRQTLSPTAEKGQLAFISGPKRAGKTSLALRFLRDAEHSTAEPCLTLHFECPTGYCWSRVEQAMCRELRLRADFLARRLGASLPELESSDLVEVVRHAQHHLHCTVILVVDEVTTLLNSSSDSVEARALSAFRARIEALPRVMLLWVGPQAQLAYAPPELQLGVLQHVESVPIESFSEDDTLELLTARNFGPRVKIHAGRYLARVVHRRTGGNPYWTSLLAGRMWESSEERVDGGRLYVLETLEEAQYQLFSRNAIAFLDRKRPRPGDRPGLADEILAALAGLDSRSSGEPMFTLEALRVWLRERGIEIGARELLGTLRFLEEQGSVAEAKVQGGRSWKISAPLLAEFLRYERSEIEIDLERDPK